MNVFNLAAKISLDTKAYETALKQAGTDIGGLGTKIADTMKHAASLAVDAIKSVASAASDFAVDAVKTGMSFDAAMSQVAATMGTTADQIGDLRDFAQEMGATTKFSATEAAEALNYMALAGYDAETSMAMLPNVLNLAAAGGMDLAAASDMLTDSLTAFGFDAKTEEGMKRAKQMTDEMAKAASITNTSVEQMGGAFLTVGALAADLRGGFVKMADGTKVAVDGVQEMEIALGMMANAGIKGSEAGTHFRNILLKMTSGGDDIKEALGVDVFDAATGKMRSLRDIFGEMSAAFAKMNDKQRLETIGMLFNTRDTAAQEAILNAIASDWDAIGEGIVNSGGAAAAMAAEMENNLAGDLTKMKSAFEGVKIALSDMVSPDLRNGVKGLSDLLSGMTVLFRGDRMAGLKSVSEAWDSIMGSIRTKVFDFVVHDLPELPKRIGEAFSKAKDFLLGELGAWKPIGEQLLRTVVNGATELAGHADEILPFLTEFAKRFTDPKALTEIVSISDGIVHNLIDGLLSEESLGAFVEGIPGVLKNLSDGFLTVLAGEDHDGKGGLVGAATEIVRKLSKFLSDDKNREKMKDAAKAMLTTLGKTLVGCAEVLLPFIGELGLSIAKALWESVTSCITWVFHPEEWGDEVHYNASQAQREAWIASGSPLPIEEWIALQSELEAIRLGAGTYDGLNYDENAQRMAEFAERTGIHIPHFAGGGIVDKPTLALIGESGREAVVPLDRESEVGNRLGGVTISFGDIYVNGEKNVGREVIRQIDEALRTYQIAQRRGTGGTAWQT